MLEWLGAHLGSLETGLESLEASLERVEMRLGSLEIGLGFEVLASSLRSVADC